MSNRVMILVAFAILLLGGVLGYAVCEWTTPDPPAPPAAVQQSETVTAIDSAARAAVFAEGYAFGAASIRPIIRTVRVDTGSTHTEVVYDETALAIADEAYRLLDSVLAEHNVLKDLVAHAVIDLPPDHSAELFYRIRERSFRGSRVTCNRPDSVRTEYREKPETFWSRFGWGPQAQMTLVTLGPAKPRWLSGASIGIGIHYSF